PIDGIVKFLYIRQAVQHIFQGLPAIFTGILPFQSPLIFQVDIHPVPFFQYLYYLRQTGVPKHNPAVLPGRYLSGTEFLDGNYLPLPVKMQLLPRIKKNMLRIRSCLYLDLSCQQGNPHVIGRSEEHTSELQSRENLVCRLLLEKKKKSTQRTIL